MSDHSGGNDKFVLSGDKIEAFAFTFFKEKCLLKGPEDLKIPHLDPRLNLKCRCYLTAWLYCCRVEREGLQLYVLLDIGTNNPYNLSV